MKLISWDRQLATTAEGPIQDAIRLITGQICFSGTIIAENTTLVLSTDSDLFKFLKGMASPSRFGASIGDVGGKL